MTAIKYKTKEVLCFSISPKDRATVKRYYNSWRKDQGIPYRCDNTSCQFHEGDLIWNDQDLKMILDHENGNSNDNRPENLHYLCPNCDAQLPTRGGKNKGRIINESDGGFQVKHRDRKLDTLVAAKTAKIRIETHNAEIEVKNDKDNS